MRRALAWTTTALLIAAGWLLAWWVGGFSNEPEPLPVALDEAVIPYTPVTRADPPRFRLLGGERQLKLITHAVADADGPLDADEVIVYGVRLTLLDLVGEVLWSGQLYTAGRRSVDPRTTIDGVPPVPDARLPDAPEHAVTDSRLLQFQIPMRIPPESRLVVEPVGAVQRLLVRLYAREAPRGALTAFRTADLLRDDAPPVDDMLAERVPRTLRWVRRSSETPTVPVVRTGNRRPFDENEVKAFVHVDPLRPVALNVEGPTDLELRLRRGAATVEEMAPFGPEPGGGELVLIDVAELGPEGAPNGGLKAPVPRELVGETVHRLRVGPGVHSFRLYTDAPDGARIRLTGPADRGLVPPDPTRPPIRFGDVPVVPYEDDELILADERRFPVFVAGPDGPPVTVGIEGPDDDLARLVRLDVRLMRPPPPPTDPLRARLAAGGLPWRLPFAPATVDVAWFDADGDRIGERVLSVAPPAAPFEEVERPDGTRLAVSEPQGLRLAVPPGTARFEVRAPRRLLVRPHVLFPSPPPHLDLPYREHLPPDHIWRYAPREFRIWYPIEPLDREVLRGADAVWTMISQVRLEPTADGEAEGPPRPPRAFSPIDPVGRPAQQRVLEDVRVDKRAEVRRRWGPGLLAEAPAGQDVRFRVDRGERARPRLLVALDGPAEALLGRRLAVTIDGAPGGRVVLGTTRFAWNLPALSAGWHTLRVAPEGDGPIPDGLSLHIDRATEATPIHHQRTLYELGRGGLDVRVPLDDDGVVLNAIVYDRRARAVPEARLTGIIDGGRPTRRRGVPVESFTLPVERAALPPANRPLTTARLVDRAGQVAGHPRTFPIRLGPDLTRGAHTVRVRADADRTLWVRFIIAEDLTRRRETVRSGTFTEAD